MGLKGIIAVSGMPGLYKVIAQNKAGFIVESLTDKKRQPISATQRISMLDDITVYMKEDDITLKEVFLKMKEHSEKNPLPEAKADDKKLRTAFAEVVPGFDSERVYNSDIKKMFAWFHMVKDFVATPDEEAKATEEPANEESAS
ncbi:MAG: hypothetical protein RL090_875 [Bacteroidota bacterium]|jgi:hypothetical protein